jgi:hypothetical protein
MNAHQRRIIRRKYARYADVINSALYPLHLAHAAIMNESTFATGGVVHISPEYKADLLSRDKTMYVQQFGRATRPHANMFPSAGSDEPEKDDFAAMEISAIEREIETVRATGDTIIGSTHGHDYELTRNKSNQVVVWIDGRRSSKHALFGIINEFHSEFK